MCQHDFIQNAFRGSVCKRECDNARVNTLAASLPKNLITRRPKLQAALFSSYSFTLSTCTVPLAKIFFRPAQTIQYLEFISASCMRAPCDRPLALLPRAAGREQFALAAP